MKYISLKTLIEKYIEGSTIDFCTDESVYGFVLGLTTYDNSKIIIKLNLNYFSPYGKSGESIIRAKTVKRGKKKNQNIDDLRREISNQTVFSELSSAIPRIKVSSILQREEAIKFSKALEKLPKNCDHLHDWTSHLIKQLNILRTKQNYKYETKTGVIIMDSVGDLTLDDIVNKRYSNLQKYNLSRHSNNHSISDTYKGKARALLLSLLWIGILHGDPHMNNIRVDSNTGKLYLIDFGASIDFGSGSRHLPKYLRNSKEAKEIFANIKKDVNNWLPLTSNLTENGFTEQYRSLLNTSQNEDKDEIIKKLLEYTIVKADPRQNGDLLTWDKIEKDNKDKQKWKLYHNGYKWIVDVDNDTNWKSMIKYAIINKDQQIDTPFISNVNSDILKGHSSKKTAIPPSDSESDEIRDIVSSMPSRFTRKKRSDYESFLKKQSRNSLISETTSRGLTTGSKWTQKSLINKILENEESIPHVIKSLNSRRQTRKKKDNNKSHSKTRKINSRYNLRSQSIL